MLMNPADLWNAPYILLDLLDATASRVFRTDLSQPGFAIPDLGDDLTPIQFRSMLIGFAAALDHAYDRRFSRRLLLRSMGRFDQKVSAEAHLDGAPDESILMLGYEPSEITSRLFLIDYTRCAFDRGLQPREFLDRFNPTFGEGRSLLDAYATELTPFDRRHFRVVMFNNSCTPVDRAERGMLGVLHKSIVVDPQSTQTRFVNTMMLSPADVAADDVIGTEDVRAYLNAGAFKAA
jgi:hypothetical protein